MIVIIEGLDGVGKTTIANKLADKLHWLYVHEGFTDDKNLKMHRVKLLFSRLMNNVDCIYDRTSLIDDFVYEFLNKSETPFKKHEALIKLLLTDCTIFHLEIDEQIRQKRFNKRGDEYITNDMIQAIDKQYKKFYKNIKNVKYIKLSGDLNKDVNKLLEEIENED